MMVRFNRKHAAALCALASVGALFAFLLADVCGNPKNRPALPGPAGISRVLSGIRIPFQENAGQFPSDVAFGARMFAGSVFVTREGGLVYSLYGRPGGTTPGKARVLRETLVGGKAWEISGEDPSSARISRFAGKDPAKWVRGIRAWDTVRLDQVYRGVDVRLKARGGSIEKIFHVRPGADPSVIHLRVDGADRLAVNDRGELEANAGKDTVRFTAPVAWQEDGEGGKTPVAAAYEVAGNEYGFRLAGYDPDREVIIDPLLAATYLGGTVGPVTDGFEDQPYAMDFDSSGNLYVAGATGSSNFPAGAGYDNVFDGTTDAFVVKLSSDLTQVLAATFLGGGSDDVATAVRVSGSSVYVAGATNSSDFPATPDPGTTRGQWDVFVVKLNLSLSSFSAGTILGGTFIDNEACLALDGSGNVFVGGRTQSPDFPVTAGTYDNVVYGPDIQPDVTDFFIAKLDGSSPSLSLLAATYLRGLASVPNTSEALPAIAVDGSDNVVLAGLSEATDYPTTAGAYNTTGGGTQVVVSKLNNALTSLLYSTFVGPSALGYRVSLSLAGDNVWIGGYASSSAFPVTGGAHRTTYASKEGFVAKLNGALSSLLASTYVGGNGDDFVTGIAAATDGSVYATGQTASSDFAATSGAFDNSFNGVLDVFVRRYSGDLASLQYSSFLFLGSTSTNTPRTFLSLDNNTGNVYVAGLTN
ncbi:MAG: SBBP repeat-containing protein, partial [Deltaproteobacteria bacterium]|nr:SBBP repeat-containing protein [Deltaproteobacteria bacterium]